MARADRSADFEAAFAKALLGERAILMHDGRRFELVTAERLAALEDAADVAAAEAALAEGPARPYDELRRKYGLT